MILTHPLDHRWRSHHDGLVHRLVTYHDSWVRIACVYAVFTLQELPPEPAESVSCLTCLAWYKR